MGGVRPARSMRRSGEAWRPESHGLCRRLTPPAPAGKAARHFRGARMFFRLLFARATVLGLLIGVGAFAIDMYIPAFPAIAASLGVGAGPVQLSMTSFFVAQAIGQIVYGPISDAVGRRGPIFVGLAMFAVASLAAALAPGIGTLIAARFVQGLGAAGATVAPLAVIRDEHTGPEAARQLSLAVLALSISPIIAPALGGLIVQYLSWRVIFLLLIGICGLIALIAARALPETHPPSRRVSMRPLSILLTYARLLRNRRFLAAVAVAASAQAMLFLFISGAPFVIVTLHGVSPARFGLLFSLHAIALIGLSQLNAPMMRRFGALRIIGAGATVACLTGLTLAGLVASGMTALVPFIALTLTLFASLSLILGPAFLTALEPFGDTAGAAAALAICLEFVCSSTATAILSALADGTALPLAAMLALAACASLAGWAWLSRLTR